MEEELEELEEEAGAAGKLWSSGGESLTLRRAATSSSTAGPVQRAARPAAAPRRRPQVSPLFTTQHRSNSPSATPLLGILGVGRFLETGSFWLATENCEDTTDSKHLT